MSIFVFSLSFVSVVFVNGLQIYEKKSRLTNVFRKKIVGVCNICIKEGKKTAVIDFLAGFFPHWDNRNKRGGSLASPLFVSLCWVHFIPVPMTLWRKFTA